MFSSISDLRGDKVGHFIWGTLGEFLQVEAFLSLRSELQGAEDGRISELLDNQGAGIWVDQMVLYMG